MREEQKSALEQVYENAEKAYSKALTKLLNARALGTKGEYDSALARSVAAEAAVDDARRALKVFLGT